MQVMTFKRGGGMEAQWKEYFGSAFSLCSFSSLNTAQILRLIQGQDVGKGVGSTTLTDNPPE